MKHTKTFLAVAVTVIGMQAATAADITIFDGQSNGKPWYGAGEDNETEPGTYSGPAWDLEAMLLDGSRLTVVGTYNFFTGQASGNRVIRSGDIFIDLDGQNSSRLDWEYVIKPVWSGNGAGSYAVYANPEAVQISDPTDIGVSTPWLYTPRSDANLIDSGTFSVTEVSGLQDWVRAGEPYWTASNPEIHRGIGFDLDFLAPGTEFWAHFTMECGNDELNGHGTTPVPDAASSLALLGIGLAGLGALRRRNV